MLPKEPEALQASWKQLSLRIFTLEGLGFVLLVGFFSGLYGFIPGLQVPSLGIWYGTWGTAHSLANRSFPFMFHLNDVLIPYGSPQLGGFVVSWFIAGLIKYLSLPDDIAGNFTGIFFLGLTLFSFVRLMLLLKVRKWIGYLCASLFLMTPFIYMHMDYGAMGFGFMLVPLSLLADFIIIQRFMDEQSDSKKKYFRFLLLILAIRLLMTGVDWYSSVIAAVGGGVIITSYFFKSLLDGKLLKRALRIPAAWLVTWVIGVLPWYFAMPHGQISEPFSMDFFRAQGVDLISLVIPKGGYLWSDICNLPQKWNGFEFFGDGTNVAYNYLGLSLTIALISSIILIVLQTTMRRNIISLMIACCVCFVLSLGPSLKIDSKRVSNKKDISEITYEDYQMPAEKAVVTLPTAPLYQIFPISLMRAVYRWLLFPRIILIIVLGLLIEWLIVHQKLKFALLLSLLAIVEIFPNYFIRFQTRMQANKWYHLTQQTLLEPLHEQLQPGERVLFLSGPENDFLASWFAPNLHVKLFNGGGDKTNWLAYNHLPEVIQRLKRYDARTNDEVNDLMLLALRSNVVDKIVVPYFSLRWDSYSWPPDENNVMENQRKFSFINDLQNDSVNVKTYKYFSILSTNVKYATMQKHVAEQVDSVTGFIETLPQNAIFLVDGAKAPLTELFSVREQKIYDFRQSEFVDAALKQNSPIYFIVTGYQKYFDTTNYRRLENMLRPYVRFGTQDYSISAVSELLYYRLHALEKTDEVDCEKLWWLLNNKADSVDIAGWLDHIDFTAARFGRQLCKGWYSYEQASSGGFRWMSSSSTLYLRIPTKPASLLSVSLYPLIDHVPGHVQHLTVFLNGFTLFHGTLSKQEPTTFNMPIPPSIHLEGTMAMVTLEVDKPLPPLPDDKRELGVIVSKVGFH